MKIGKLVLLAGAALGLGGVAMAAEPTTIDRDEVRAVVAEMLADAETRSSLLQGGASAGHDGKFFIASNDGNFRLNLGGQIQFRYIINFSDEDNALTEDEFDTGFQTRRTKLDFTGHVINPNWTYRVLTNFDRANGNAFLEDAFVEYRFASGMRARWGQFKLP
ncbi:MAG TPA: porin, partial [Phycisphaerales bacterium]|nr:porin [Phycisphaerales bacterium]